MNSLKFVMSGLLVLATASVLTGQTVQQNIDSACVQVLGSACSTNSSLGSTNQNIQAAINNRTLASDASSIMYNYLMPMLKASVGMQLNLIDWAWKAAGCKGAVAESQWSSKFGTASGQWQTYQQLVGMMNPLAGCAPAVAAPTVAATQYVGTAAMQAANVTVWGAGAGSAPIPTNCPVSPGAVSCARGALASYVPSHGTILTTIATPVFASVIGFAPTSTYMTAMAQTFGRYWSGADDLATYLSSTRSAWPKPAAVTSSSGGSTASGSQLQVLSASSHLDSQGYMIDGAGARIISACGGNYYLSVQGTQLVASGGGNYTANFNGKAMIVSTNGGTIGILVNSGGNAYVITAAGLVAAGGGNLVAAGGGNLVAAGGGNLVAAGGGNLVAAGGGNFQGMTTAAAAQAAHFPAGVLSTSGLNQAVLVQALSAGQLAQGVSAGQTNAGAIGAGNGALTGGSYALQSVTTATSAPTPFAARLTGPTTISRNSSITVAWTESGVPSAQQKSCGWNVWLTLNGNNYSLASHVPATNTQVPIQAAMTNILAVTANTKGTLTLLDGCSNQPLSSLAVAFTVH